VPSAFDAIVVGCVGDGRPTNKNDPAATSVATAERDTSEDLIGVLLPGTTGLDREVQSVRDRQAQRRIGRRTFGSTPLRSGRRS
jgi:hypothetical protein